LEESSVASSDSTDVQRLIDGYITHVDDQDYVERVLGSADAEAVAQTLASLVGGGDRQSTWDAILFAQDAAFRPSGGRFQRLLWHGGFVDALRANLYVPDALIRHNSIPSLGRLGPRANAQFMIAALPWYKQHDPFGIEGLLVEIAWLTQKRSWPWLKEMAKADLYLTRWATAAFLWNRELGMGVYPVRQAAKPRQLLRQLAQDAHPLVRLEAQWHLRELKVSQQKLFAFAAVPSELDPDFSKLGQNLHNYLSITGRRDYDLPLVEKVAQHLREHPIEPGYDIQSYWGALI
jgi:hypothetical protein